MPRGKTKESVIMQINGNNFFKLSFYETPLYGRVQSDKQDSDNGQGLRRRRSP
jgi:hypothetical protein